MYTNEGSLKRPAEQSVLITCLVDRAHRQSAQVQQVTEQPMWFGTVEQIKGKY